MNNCLEITDLRKCFKDFQLEDITFTLPEGFIMGLIGPNGAGKTTIIKLILNMLKKDNGKITVMGYDNAKEEQRIKSGTGVVFDSNCFSDEWKVSQVEKYISPFYPRWSSRKFSGLLKRFQLEPSKKIKNLSKGMKMKLMLACALSYDARLLILDEPTSGLDPVSRDELLNILSKYIEDGRHSVLFSTHITEDLERIADYITYIKDGSMFYTGGKDEFISMFRIVKGGPEDFSQELSEKVLGVREFSTGFEALLNTEYVSLFPNLHSEPASIDDIIVFTNKKGDIEHE